MSADNQTGTVARQLPGNPDLRHLKDQAKQLLKSGGAKSLAAAQFQIARTYGFPSWPKLKRHVEMLTEAGELKNAIDSGDYDRARAMLTRNPELHRAPLGYGKSGPLTWVAECRVPRQPATPERLAFTRWMVENGSDIHQGGDAPLARAALDAYRIPMMELLVSLGADVNALWFGQFPILFAPCESLDPEVIEWLLAHGANPNIGGFAGCETALDYLLGTYVRDPPVLAQAIGLLVRAGGRTRFDAPGVLAMLQGRLDELSRSIDADPQLVHRRFPQLAFGSTAGRMLLLSGATLLHVAAEFWQFDAAKLLIERGADVNAKALIAGDIGGQTPAFHAATQNQDGGIEVLRLLLDRGADLKVTARLPGYYESPGEVVECTPLGYAERFAVPDGEVVELLRARCAIQ